MNKNIITNLLTFALLVALLPSHTYASEKTFNDILTSQNKEYIEIFAEQGYITGYPDGSFKPNGNITRAEIATIFAKFDIPIKSTPINFTDVKDSDWFKEFTDKTSSNKIINGYSDKTFKPQNNITRFEAIRLVSMLGRSEDYDKVQLPYVDSNKIPSWVINDVRNLYSLGVIKDYPSNQINGNQMATREEIVTMMAKLMAKKNWNKEIIERAITDSLTNPLPVPTALPQELIGYLSIPSINLKSNPVRDGATLENMKITISHFAETPIFDGNVSFCAHNRDYTYDFRNLKNVKVGDEILYKTNFGERKYKVTKITNVQETDWSMILEKTPNNCLTLLTCVEDKPAFRLVVRAEQN